MEQLNYMHVVMNCHCKTCGSFVLGSSTVSVGDVIHLALHHKLKIPADEVDREGCRVMLELVCCVSTMELSMLMYLFCSANEKCPF